MSELEKFLKSLANKYEKKMTIKLNIRIFIKHDEPQDKRKYSGRFKINLFTVQAIIMHTASIVVIFVIVLLIY